MKSINLYITEKLRINKDTKISSKKETLIIYQNEETGSKCFYQYSDREWSQKFIDTFSKLHNVLQVLIGDLKDLQEIEELHRQRKYKEAMNWAKLNNVKIVF